MIQEDVKIVAHKKLSSNFFKITLLSKYISSHATPGQFVDLRVTDKTTPLLRKPFSIHRIDKEKETIDILYEVLGTGTTILSEKNIGETINVLGPLGSGFNLEDKTKTIHILVGGGMGIAPLLSLADKLRISNIESRIFVLIGARNRDAILCEDDFKSLGVQIKTSTDDGSYGKKGFVSETLLDLLNNQLSTFDYPLSTIFSCGPHPMLKSISDIAGQKNIDCQISTEAYMACGIGACKGCAVKTKSGYKMACKDGPVFDAKELLWN